MVISSTSGMYTCSTNVRIARDPLAQEVDPLWVDRLRTVGIDRHRHPADEERLRVRVLAAEHRVNPDHIALPLERVEVVSDRSAGSPRESADTPGVPNSRS